MPNGVDPIANQIVAGTIVAALGAFLTYWIGKRSGRQEYEQLVRKLDTTVYGQDGVEPMRGLAEIANSHETRIQENKSEMRQTREELEEVKDELEEVREMVREVKQECERNAAEE